MLTTDWITLTVTTAPTLALPLGTSPEGEPVSLDLDASPNALVVGPCGSGKTVLLRHLATSANILGAKVIAIDPIFRGLHFKGIEGIDTLATSATEAVDALEGVLTEIARRGELFEKHNVLHWKQLPEEVRDAEDVRPIVIFIDEYASTVVEETLPRGADLGSDWYREAEERIADAARIKYQTQRILRESRFYGAHLFIATQRPEAATLSRAARDDIGNTVLMLRPGHTASDTAIAMAFGLENVEAVTAAMQEGVGSAAYGDAVLAIAGGGVKRVNVPYSK